MEIGVEMAEVMEVWMWEKEGIAKRGGTEQMEEEK